LNLCRRQWQRRAGRPREQSVSQRWAWGRTESNEPFTQETGLAHALRTERREVLHRLLRQLPEPQADAVRLRFLGELPFADIAQTMDSSLSAAKQRVKQGLTALARLLQDKGMGDSE
jgi:RNA polymerase sigma-70 factor (ECF subfamily)